MELILYNYKTTFNNTNSVMIFIWFLLSKEMPYDRCNHLSIISHIIIFFFVRFYSSSS